MRDKKLGLESAFPNGMEVNNEFGMSKRFYTACIAMQGILASSKGFMCKSGNTSYSLFNKVEFAYECADELLRQENL